MPTGQFDSLCDESGESTLYGLQKQDELLNDDQV